MNLCGLTMPYFAKTAHEGLQTKLDKSAAAVHNQFPGAKVQKTNINMWSMYEAAHQICQNTLAALLDNDKRYTDLQQKRSRGHSYVPQVAKRPSVG